MSYCLCTRLVQHLAEGRLPAWFLRDPCIVEKCLTPLKIRVEKLILSFEKLI